MRRISLALVLAAVPALAVAQPRTPDKPVDKSDAKALLASGLKLFQAKDYLGALAVFKDAYARFPSPKILLNIGTTLAKLGRNAEAANTYQAYLDAPDADSAKKPEVTKVLAELDGKVGVVELTVAPAEAEVQFEGEEEWIAARSATLHRVAPGSFRVRARADKFTGAETSGEVAAGKHATIALRLAPIPEVSVTTATLDAQTPTGGELRDDGGPTPARAPSRFGAYALAHFDIANKGGAARIAGTFEVLPRLQAELGAIVGPASGGYVGARYAFLPGRWRPVLAIGAPIFVKDGAHVALRGAAGLEFMVTPRISLVVEAGVERVLNPGMTYVETVFVPALGAAGRL